MKAMKLSLVIVAAALLTIGLGGMAYAFHDGGVANCESCHTMHNSIGDTAVVPGSTQFTGVAYLLKNSDQSSTCINCHSGATLSGKNVFTTGTLTGVGPANYTPGGDFAWLTKSFSTSPTGAISSRLGHNVVAKDFNLTVDATLTKAPGGSYLAKNLSCISCHDPHPKARIDSTYTIVYPTLGQKVPPIYKSGSYGDLPTATEAVGTYRFLGGKNYVPVSVGTPAFVNDPPVAVAPSTYNRKETTGTGDTRVAYGTGMSEWCANCHGSITANDAVTHFIHPASSSAVLGSTITANYNAYLKSGDLTNTPNKSYTSLVSFEEGLGESQANITTLKSHAGGGFGSTAGPTGANENVMCLSCHRAHASGFKNMTRWNNAEFITSASAYSLTGTMTSVEYQAAMYDRAPDGGAFATFQRSLCNKCHMKD